MVGYDLHLHAVEAADKMWGICQAQNLVSPLLLLLLFLLQKLFSVFPSRTWALVSGEHYALTAVKQDHYRGAAEGGGLDLLQNPPFPHPGKYLANQQVSVPQLPPLCRSFIEVVVKKEMWPGSDGCGLS